MEDVGLLVNGVGDLVTADPSDKGEDGWAFAISVFTAQVSGWCAWSSVRQNTSSGKELSQGSPLRVWTAREVPGDWRWRKAAVEPIFKKGKKRNYKLISFPSSPGQITEQAILEVISSHMKEKVVPGKR